MPEQPQWQERTLDMPPQDPWGEQPTTRTGPPSRPQGHDSAPRPFGADPATRPYGADSATRPYGSAAPARPHGGEPGTRAFGGDHDLQSTQPYPDEQGSPSTRPFSPAPGQSEPESPFSRGRATVGAPQSRSRYAEQDQTSTGWSGGEQPRERPAISWRWSDLRRGGEWTSAATLFAFVGWGIWAISTGGDLGGPLIVFLITLLVAAGVFCLARLVGHLVLERWLGRTRHGARGSHLVTAVFLVGVGIVDLKQVPWIIDAWNWVAGSGFFK